MKARAVWFPAARQVDLVDTPVADPGAHQVLVRASVSLISPGTEMLVYRGEATSGDLMPPNSEGSFCFPIKYGYQCIGRVEATGSDSGFSVGDRVFARHPHQDLFTTNTADTWVTRLPDSVDDDAAAFLNLARVGLSANLDRPVKIGEVVVIFGQGIVGLLTGVLARRNAGKLIVVDPVSSRRDRAMRLGADVAVHPDQAAEAVAEITRGRGADVSFEASGSPSALQSSIELTGEYGTIVVQSYFGRREVNLRLAPEFHWRRQRILSSHAGTQRRWDAQRRTEATLELLPELPVKELISERVPFSEACRAYDLVDREKATVLGVLLDYGAEHG